ncbi:hypothetical protein [Pikeienuella sp. HZG-20]|uniref:hypothetical protein n=1 Tax=Paludibacillus litoralis TaxID=3133267 RepID=UPI0030ED0EC7
MGEARGNLSSAVRQQRREPHGSLNDFPTPPWATRALLTHPAVTDDFSAMTVREPAANRGHMVRPLAERFGRVLASDIFDYGAGYREVDYLFDAPAPVDWTITNPPFSLAERFIHKALDESRIGVAMFARSAFLEGVGRHGRLFDLTPPALILQFTERVVIHKGRLAPEGSSATAYCWIVWRLDWLCQTEDLDPRFGWIAPCRKRLERPGDYPEDAA